VARGTRPRTRAIPNNAGTTDTVLHALEGAVSGLPPPGRFVVVMYLMNVGVRCWRSGPVLCRARHAGEARRSAGPRSATTCGAGRAMVVTAYQSASGWMNLFTPASAS
jgi:uncharacterized ion transporter superfamily protein YfcC